MSDAFEAVRRRVAARVTPDEAERTELDAVTREVLGRAREAVEALDLEATVELVGSTARDTWTAGDRDVDVFVCFPPHTDRADLESNGLAVGHRVLPDGREAYAEHPYVTGTVDGWAVDLVPCFDVADASEARSAVDRTPFHTRYVSERLTPDLAEDVRVLKHFCKAVGVYGSDLRTRGFSGYLTELLVLEYGSFRDVLEEAADWHPPVRLDPADHGDGRFEDPLVCVDPTDPGRNVAAVVTAANRARFQHHARELLNAPDVARFEPADPDPMDESSVTRALERRGTTPVAVAFDAPDLVDDQLWPQLEKSLDGVRTELDRRGFDVLRADAFASDRAVLLLELEVARRPRVERHDGPPVHVRDHAREFLAAHRDAGRTGPFIEGERYVVEREREFARAEAFLRSDGLFDVALGADVERALASEYDVLVGAEVGRLAAEFGTDLARYFDPKP